ncbi:MAG: tetratricopeptide repeat protein [Gemmatimonadota bacterium]
MTDPGGSTPQSGGLDSTFHRVMAVVDAALDRPPGTRAAFLEEACGGDHALFSRARSLLASAEGPDADGVERRLASAVGAAASHALGQAHPERIGRYTVLRVLGEGGMGTVYAARQEEPVRRKVAIKVIRPGMHAPDLVARFRAERQTLATLQHPNIAELYEAGTTDDGLPYFVMELIDGEPITAYCDTRSLDLQGRIRLFRTLLGAVQHAHQKTLVHRDLKPSNVLVAEVDGRPVLKVIDFGVARVTTGEAELTRPTGPGIGTLEYMSPETLLHRGHRADTRSDIYSLGVLLYELVAGVHPFGRQRFKDATPSEIERMLLKDPVTGATRERTGRNRDGEGRRRWGKGAPKINPDLDRIIEVAMARKPSRRYATVVGFDADLGRFLEGRPINARLPRWSYRAARFLDRNRVPVTGATVALVILLGTAASFTLRLADERDRAEREAATAQQVAGMLQSVFEVSDPATPTAADLTARELLDRASDRIEVELAGQPEVQGALLTVLGRTYGGLGLWDDAERHLEHAITLAGEDRAEQAHRQLVLGEIRTQAGNLEDGETVLQEALAIREETLGRDHPITAVVLGELSVVRRAQGDLDGAEAFAREALEILRAAPDPDGLSVAEVLHSLGFIATSRASYPESEEAYREALVLREAELDPTHPDVLTTRGNLALTLENLGRYEEAEALLRETLDARQSRLGVEHPMSLISLNNLAYMLWRTGQYARATESFQAVVQIGTRQTPEGSPELAIMVNNLGVAHRRLGALAASEETHRAALAMNRRHLGDSHPRIAGDLDNLGKTVLALGRIAEAEALHRDALAMRDEHLGTQHPGRAESLAALGQARLARGETEEGLEMLQEALGIRRESLGVEHPRTAESLYDLGVAHHEAGHSSRAEANLREALAIRRAALGPDHPDVAVTLAALSELPE